ncbi:DUF2267 domain-containing protein [Sphaerisporangium perillae]|nr:DUF2267 domain-containing protein [Sphaerisporangium perillae]
MTVKETRGGVRTALLTLRDAVSDGAFDHAMSQLPDDFQKVTE